MSIDAIQTFLGWSSLINIGVLLYWALFMKFAPSLVYRYSKIWVDVSEAHFNAIHYSLMGAYKLGFIFFNIVPYLVLRFIM